MEPVEDACRAFQQAQAERVNIRIGSNTTVIGLRGAEITGADVQVDQETNVILRGLTATDAYDRFPPGTRRTGTPATGTPSTTRFHGSKDFHHHLVSLRASWMGSPGVFSLRGVPIE